MDWSEELYMIQHDMDKEQYDQYNKARWSSVNLVVKLMLILGSALLIGYCASVL